MSSHGGPGKGSIDLAGMKSVEELAREFEDVVLERVRRLERGNRSLRLWVAVLVVLVALLMGGGAFLAYEMVTGAPTIASRRVTSREFVLADASGRARGSWGVEPDGAVRLVLQDRANQPRLRFTVLGENGAPGLSLLDERGVTHVVLGILPDGTTSLVLADATGHSRAVLGVADDAAHLVFADRFGVTRAGVGVDAAGKPDLSLFDQAAAQDSAGPDSAVVDSSAARAVPAPPRRK